jgi:membrane protein
MMENWKYSTGTQTAPAEPTGAVVTTATGTAVAPAPDRDQSPVVKPKQAPAVLRLLRHLFQGYRARLLPTAKFLTETEVHTYAFSVAANAILSFFPFVVLQLAFIRHVFKSQAMFNALLDLIRDNVPAGQEFLVRSFKAIAGDHHGLQLASAIILLITSTGVFMPLEVALNRVWGFKKDRSYLFNQIVSLGLAFGAGLLALISVALTAGHQKVFVFVLGDNIVEHGLDFLLRKIIALVASIAIFFLIYWLLPHGKVKAIDVAPAAILSGVIWEVGKYIYMLTLPWLNFQDVYGPFATSVTLMFWAFITGLLLQGGAFLSAAPARQLAKAAQAAEYPH